MKSTMISVISMLSEQNYKNCQFSCLVRLVRLCSMASLTRLDMSYFDPAKCGSPDDVDSNLH